MAWHGACDFSFQLSTLHGALYCFTDRQGASLRTLVLSGVHHDAPSFNGGGQFFANVYGQPGDRPPDNVIRRPVCIFSSQGYSLSPFVGRNMEIKIRRQRVKGVDKPPHQS